MEKLNSSFDVIFQSTLPRRERHQRIRRGRENDQNFNPRSHEGSDTETDGGADPESDISIHAPTKGATDSYNGDYYYQSISIHAPTKGATRRPGQTARINNISIHAPTKGATQRKSDDMGIRMISIHAPTKGATLTATQ